MNSSLYSSLSKSRLLGSNITFYTFVALALASLVCGDLRANPGYKAKSGKVSFTVGSNIPMLKVAGSSSAVVGSGEASVNENTATINNLRFEVDPKTLSTGMGLRDQHMREKVFAASDGSLPPIVLKAAGFQAKLDPAKSKWEGNVKGQLTMRGVTRPISFHATGDKKGNGAVVSAEGRVKTSEFGVKPISYSGATVDDEVTVTVSNLFIAP